MTYFCTNSPSDLYRNISFCGTGFMSYTFISWTFAFLLPLKIPHIPQTIYISLFSAATVVFESEVKVKVTQSCLTLCDPMNYTVHGILQPEYWSGLPFPSPRDLPNPEIEPRSPALWVNSLPTKPQGKPKNSRVGSLSLLQHIFLTQESDWSLLHYRQILYQLIYQEAYSIALFRIHFIFTLTSVDMEVHVQRPWWGWCWCSVVSDSLWPHAL